jgi:hypothetical protein
MAKYFLHVKVFSRGKGSRVTRAAAYRAASASATSRRADERTSGRADERGLQLLTASRLDCSAYEMRRGISASTRTASIGKCVRA